MAEANANRVAWGLCAVLTVVVTVGTGVLVKPYIDARFGGYKRDFHGMSLLHAPLPGADLSGANLCETNLYSADLRHAELWRVKAVGTDLRYADLTNADISDANLSAAKLRGAILCGASLISTNLQKAILTGANLRGVKVNAADLTGADLRNADFTNALFGTPDALYPYLPGPILHHADLRGANLSGPNALTLADFHGARYDVYTRWPAGFDPVKHGARLVK
jgi:uncharacterized protein YjbI with pentapeptide repeats